MLPIMTTVSVADTETTAFHRAMILTTVVLATTLYGMTIMVVSVLLPQMQGSLSATQDQIAWVMTFNILATAVVTPMTGWLAAKFGRRRLMLFGVSGFVLATIGCGLAGSLETVILFRILQGASGAPLVPMAQAIVLDTFPKRQHGTATAIFGMGVVVGPVIGPTIGGYLAELYNWRWAFFMIVPFGMVSFIGLWVFLTDRGKEAGVRLSWIGFLAISTAVVGLQLLLDRGQRQDWFESSEITIAAVCGAVAFYVFLVHSLTSRRPFLQLRLLLDRNYALGLIIVTVYGMLNFTPMVLLPPFLQSLVGYPDSIVGMLLAARGIGAVAGFFLAMFVSKLDPRIGIAAGFILQGFSGLHMASFNLNVAISDVAINSTVQGLAIGLIWVPLTVATFANMNPRFLAEASAVFHLLRNIGSSIFISLCVIMIFRAGQISYAELTQHISVYNEVLGYNWAIGGWATGNARDLAALGGEIGRQATLIGNLNAFRLYAATCFAVLPLVFFVRMPKR
jgi:DHA2 family multidrug resistance protein